jgi:septal ring factor EnvC (AmiA/AmiB activator)
MMVCIVAGGLAQKPKTKPATTKTQQTQRSQKSQQSQKNNNKQALQSQQRQLQKDIAANKAKKAALEKQVKEQLEAVLVLGGEIDEKKRSIDTIRVGIDSLDAQLVVLERQLNRLQSELDARQQRYARSVRYMHRNNKKQSKMMFIFSAKNVNQMYRRTRFMKEYATYQRVQGEAVKQKREQVDLKRQEVKASKDEKAALLARGEREQQELEEQQDRKQQMAKDLQKQQKTVAALITQQQQQEAALNKRIDQMIAAEIAREDANLKTERTRKEQRTGNAQASNNSNGSKKSRKSKKPDKKPQASYTNSDADARLTGSFASNKGRLPMPITGAYTQVCGFGPNVVDGTKGVVINSKGISLKGQPGAQARCVFNGKVSKIYSDGNSYIIMVRHGRYISVYSGIVAVSVNVGQKVTTSQILGNLGSKSLMQFQLRNWTEVLNPHSWLRR